MCKVNKLTLSSSAYPAQLKEISSPPNPLYVVGNIDALSQPAGLAVIGSRKPTNYGQVVTERLAGEAAQYGITIVSGLALGVDAIALESAVTNKGTAIAVLPAGLDTIYPKTNKKLAEKIIASGGLLISEYAPGTPPLKQHFIARNRIVSGLSQAILITEAAEKSGTLHTASFALEQGRTVLAVPGNITSQFSRGTNQLIAKGATPALTVSDLLREFGKTGPRKVVVPKADNKEEAIILQLLAQNEISEGQILLEQSELDAATFNQAMTMMEMTGKIRPLGADTWALAQK